MASQLNPWETLRAPGAVVVASMLVLGGVGAIDDYGRMRVQEGNIVTVVDSTIVAGALAVIVLALLVWRSARAAASSGAALVLAACVQAVAAYGVKGVEGASPVLEWLAILPALAGGLLLGHAMVCTILEHGKKARGLGYDPFVLADPFRPVRVLLGLGAGLLAGWLLTKTIGMVGVYRPLEPSTWRGSVFMLLLVGVMVALTAILCPLGPVASMVVVVLRLDPALKENPVLAKNPVLEERVVVLQEIVGSMLWQAIILAVCLALVLTLPGARSRSLA